MTGEYVLVEESKINEILNILQNREQKLEAQKPEISQEKTINDGVTLVTGVLDNMKTTDKALLYRYQKLYGDKTFILKADVLKHAKINPETKRQNRLTIAFVEGRKIYEIKAHEKYGLSCSCESWIYNTTKQRTCKHTDKVQKYVEVV